MQRLLKRRDFLFVRDGRRASAGTLSLQARSREAAPSGFAPAPGEEPRIGFTVTKKEGCAVERNRIRRRLREAVRLSGALHARASHDYVVVGRRAALDATFTTIIDDMVAAFGRVHAERRDARRPRRPADEAAR